jgi:hypothetical protein
VPENYCPPNFLIWRVQFGILGRIIHWLIYFALQMLLATESGGLDTRDDWINWLLSAGFSHPKQVALPEWVGSSLTVAVKPGE